MATQGFVQLHQGGQGQAPSAFQPPQQGFVNLNQQARPTPPPGPPMAQMPYTHTAHHGGDFRGAPFTPSPHDGPGPHGMSRAFSYQGHSTRRGRPVVHNALERRPQPRSQIYNLRSRVTTEGEARNALSSYIVWSIKKAESTTEFDDNGLLVVPTWERAKHTRDDGVSQEEAARKVRDLQLDTEPVSDKKARLATAIKEQIDHSLEQLEEEDEDPETFCYHLVQFHQSIKRTEISPYLSEQYIEDGRRGGSSRRSHSRSRSRNRHSSKDKKKRDYKRGFSLYETPRSYKPKHRKQTQRQTDSITAYYRRVPRDGINCLQMWEDLQDGFGSWESPHLSPVPRSQKLFSGHGQYPSQQFGSHHNHTATGHHQAHQMPMNQAQGHQGFPPQSIHGIQQQAGGLPQHQFGQQGAHGMHPQAGGHPPQQFGQHQVPSNLAQQQHGPHGQQGFQQHQHQQAPHNQQAFPQQPQYAHNQGQQSFPPQGQQGRPLNGQHPQMRQGQQGGQQVFPQGAGRGQPPQVNHPQRHGQQNGSMGRSIPQNQGVQRPVQQRQGQPQQRHNVPPQPPAHGHPTDKNIGRPPRVFATSPRSSDSSFSGSDDDSRYDSGDETPPSSVDGRDRGRQRHKNAVRSRSQSRGNNPKVYGAAAREHSKGARWARSVSPPDFRPRSAMRNTSRPDLNRTAPWPNDYGRSMQRPTADGFDQVPTRPMMNSFDHEMLARAISGNFDRRAPPRRAYSDDFTPRRSPMSDLDGSIPRRRVGSDFDDSRFAKGGIGRDFRRVSPAAARQAMFEDDMDIMSDNFDGMRLNRGFGSGDRRGFAGADRLERGFKDRFRGREYYDDDDFKRTRFADEARGRDYGKPTGRMFVNDGHRTFRRGNAGHPYRDYVSP